MSGVVTDGAESTDMSDTTQLINHVFNIQNRTNTGDPLFTKYIPSVIAGLTGWDLGLRTSEPANIAVEISLDLTDMNGNRIVQPGDTTATLSMPSTITRRPALANSHERSATTPHSTRSQSARKASSIGNFARVEDTFERRPSVYERERSSAVGSSVSARSKA